MLKRILFALLVALISLGVMIGGEIVVALRREYLPTEPALLVEGSFGNTDATPLRFVVLGDSSAAGVGAGDAEHAFPTLLAKRLAADGYRVEMMSLGTPGARVSDLVAQQVQPAVDMEPDLVLVAIGANDVTHLTSLSDIRAGMTEAIERLKAAGATVVVAGVPDMRAAAFHEPLRSLAGWRGRSVTDAIAEVAERADVPVVPLAEETYWYFAADPEAHNSSDLFHPSAIGYERWADAIYPYLESALGLAG